MTSAEVRKQIPDIARLGADLTVGNHIEQTVPSGSRRVSRKYLAEVLARLQTDKGKPFERQIERKMSTVHADILVAIK